MATATVEILTTGGNQIGDPVTSGPLASLDTSAQSANYRYPDTLGSSNSGKNNKNHWVLFTIKNIEPVSVGQSTGGTNASQITNVSVGNAGTGVAAVAGLTAVATAATSFLVNDNLSGTQGLGLTVSAAVAQTLFGGKGLTVSPPIGNIVSTIALYMPDSLTASYSANYEEMSLTSDLGPLVTTLRAIGSAGGVGNVVESLKGIGNNKGTDPNVINAITGILETTGQNLAGLNVENIGTILQRASGYALNPQLQMIYRGTRLRSFDLEFTFTPKSQSEANQVNNIIKAFRYYSSPTLSSGKSGSSNPSTDGMYLIPPSIFNLQFFVKGEVSNYLPKYGDCILESVNVNHAPNGFAVFDADGSMVQTQLSLSFTEMDILTRDKIDSGDRQ